MSHPSSRTETFDDVKIVARSFRTNLLVYKAIGGKVTVRGERRVRRWWCGWLCKTNVSIDADRILLENDYFSRVEGTAILVQSASHAGECRNDSDCTRKHSAGGIGVKITFPNGGMSPSTIDNLLPLDGVISRASVTVRGRTFNFETASGPHPG
jgi:hypothetical protein